MIEYEPSVKEMAALWRVCVEFIEEHDIGCPEQIYQTDMIIEDAYTLIEAICNKVGYIED